MVENRHRGDLVFFLGGYDLEMETIANLLAECNAHVHDKHLGWGARTSAYTGEIEESIQTGKTPVLVELNDDIGLSPEEVIFIDHHDLLSSATQPTSLHQVFSLLNLPREHWTRWFDLVAANDRGYVPALVQAGAKREEIIELRTADRKAQGITEEEELQGKAAIDSAETYAQGILNVVRLPHAKAAVVTDLLQPELGGPGYTNLLVLSPDEVNFFGDGEVIRALAERFPSGWYGGALPERGFWGHEKPVPDVLSFIVQYLQSTSLREEPECV
jgi:hypothetical protein